MARGFVGIGNQSPKGRKSESLAPYPGPTIETFHDGIHGNGH